MTGEQPPLTMLSRNGEFLGLDVALMRVLARSMGAEARFLRFQFDQLLDALDAGEVDGLIADRETCFFAVLRYPGEGLIAPEATFTLEPMGIAVPRDQPQLANLLRTYLTALSDTGALERAKAFWFEDPSWVKSLR